MKCVFCGAVKNCGKYLNAVFKNIEKLGTLFEEYAIIIYCDKSIDNSVIMLNEYRKRNPRLTYYYNPTPVSRFRTHRLAHARNECLKIVYNQFREFPYFIMMDFDDVCSEPVKIDALRKYLYDDTWDALSFNKKPYYDTWALSIHPFAFSFNHMKRPICPQMLDYISEIMKKHNGLIACMSAFNGCAIYRASKFVNCWYDGTLRLDLLPANYTISTLRLLKNEFKFGPPGSERSTVEDCEHRSFHLMAIHKNGARIRISPDVLF